MVRRDKVGMRSTIQRSPCMCICVLQSHFIGESNSFLTTTTRCRHTRCPAAHRSSPSRRSRTFSARLGCFTVEAVDVNRETGAGGWLFRVEGSPAIRVAVGVSPGSFCSVTTSGEMTRGFRIATDAAHGKE